MSRSAYGIRLARLSDLGALAEVERSAATVFFAELGHLSGIADTLPPEVLEACHAAGLLWIAADEHDAPVGFLAAQVLDDNSS